MALAYIGLGGNRRQTRRVLGAAARALKKIPSARMAGVSRVFISPPLGCPGSQPHYRNTAAKLQTASSPRRIFSALRGIESRMQKRFRRRNAPRILDADYLTHGAAILRGRSLRLPHPRMAARAFVLAPLAELAGRDFSGVPKSATLARALPQISAAQKIRPADGR